MTGAEIRECLGHPVIDCDAHVIEYLPLVRDFVVEDGGDAAARRFDAAVGGTAMVGRLPPAARAARSLLFGGVPARSRTGISDPRGDRVGATRSSC